MKKRIQKLVLHRETLRHLESPEMKRALGMGAVVKTGEENPSIQSGETYCWCTDSCDCTEIQTGP